MASSSTDASIKDEKVLNEEIGSETPHKYSLANQSTRNLLLLSFGALGIIYGDLGTSPLYVINAVFPSSGDVPSTEDVIGLLSSIIWTITLLPLLKYSIIALQFGNGSAEGGPLAVWSSLYPRKVDLTANRALTSFPTFSSRLHEPSAPFFESKPVRLVLLGWTLFAVGLTISDGMLTPAVSVVSAVGGIAIAAPSVASSVLPISIAILVLLFIAQAAGTARVGKTFSPIMILFFLIIGISGIINIAQYPGVFRAIDPSRSVAWFMRTKSFDSLAGVLLCVTGCEAMFANLGQFSKGSIRLPFIAFVYPCLVFAYLGQGARLITDPETVLPNVYYGSIPGATGGPFYWITFVVTIAAAVIASQAMISATFSLTQQLVTLRAMPPVKIIHTSSIVEGQVYAPVINLLMMAGTIAFVGGFGVTGPGLTNAYGFAVATVFIVTTTLIAIAIVRVKHRSLWLALLFLIFFGFVDSLFWGASLKKVPEGAYAPLAIGIFITIFLLYWSWARDLEDQFDTNNRGRLTDIIRRVQTEAPEADQPETEEFDAQGGLRMRLPPKKRNTIADGDKLELVDGSVPLNRLPVFAFFHNESGNAMDGTPHAFAAFVRIYPSLPQVIVFFSILVVEKAYTTEDERYVVSRVRSFDGIYIAKLFVGYRDVVDLTTIAQPIFESIKSLERSSDDPEAEERIVAIQSAMTQSVTHIVPHHYLKAKKSGNRFVDYIRAFLIESVYRRLQTAPEAAYILQDDDVLRMGVTAAL